MLLTRVNHGGNRYTDQSIPNALAIPSAATEHSHEGTHLVRREDVVVLIDLLYRQHRHVREACAREAAHFLLLIEDA